MASQTGNTEDVNVNTFAVSAPSTPNSLQLGAWRAAIKAFYDARLTSGALRGRAQTGHTMKFYAADTSVPNYPIDQQAWSLFGGPGPVQLPGEVCLCVSYANDSANSVPRGRRRGRIYISGWSDTINVAGRPQNGSCEEQAFQFATYVEAVNDITDFRAGVYSRLNSLVYPIERVWVDNEWDTMRSRGGKSTYRQTVGIVP